MIYLDSNATSQPLAEVIDAMTSVLREHWGNPSSTHRFGGNARRLLDTARGQVASLIGCRPRDVVLTSGGTESVMLAVRGSLAAQPTRTHIVTSPLEHSALRETAKVLEKEGVTVHWLTHEANGLVDLDRLETLLQQYGDDIALVSQMWVNNETGVIQPINAIGAMCREFGVRFHTDAVQAVGKIDVDCAALNVDLLSLSGHKLHGPKGTGGLYIARGVALEPQSLGGSQEQNRRGGTENVPGIVGLGIAAEHAKAWLATDGPTVSASLREGFEADVQRRLPSVVVNAGGAPRVWNTSSLGFEGLEAEGLLMILSERDVCASGGAACASGSLEPSPVLLAMDIPESIAHGSLRFSLSRFTSKQELDVAIDVIEAAVHTLSKSVV